MFIVHTVRDTILIPASALAQPSVQAIQNEIDQRYPNRILMDVGLVIARYGDSLEHVSHGVCVAGQAGAHHHCSFPLIIFRPSVEEVCLGRVHRSTDEGIHVSLGFFEDIFIPAYWMLKPSTFDEKTGLWVWTPSDDDVDDDDDDDDNNEGDGNDAEEANGNKQQENGNSQTTSDSTNIRTMKDSGETTTENKEQPTEENEFFQMEIGAEIRFKVKSIHFARITNSAKGLQAILSTTDKPRGMGSNKRHKSNGTAPLLDANNSVVSGGTTSEAAATGEAPPGGPLRRRSSSVGLDDEAELPPTMHIVASICEDGLGLTRWWEGGDDDEDNGDEQDSDGGDKERE